MKVKEVSKAFGMNVKNFAVLCKCSRQSLYNFIEGYAPTNAEHFEAMLDRLQVVSDDTYANDILKAMDKKLLWAVVGDGPDMDKLRKKIVEADVADCILMVGKRLNPFSFFV